MAEQHYRMDGNASPQARDLYQKLMDLDERWDAVKRHFDAMTQQKDGDGTLASHFVTVQGIYQFQDEAKAASTTDAKGGYDELNSMIGNCNAALKQCCAKFR